MCISIVYAQISYSVLLFISAEYLSTLVNTQTYRPPHCTHLVFCVMRNHCVSTTLPFASCCCLRLCNMRFTACFDSVSKLLYTFCFSVNLSLQVTSQHCQFGSKDPSSRELSTAPKLFLLCNVQSLCINCTTCFIVCGFPVQISIYFSLCTLVSRP